MILSYFWEALMHTSRINIVMGNFQIHNYILIQRWNDYSLRYYRNVVVVTNCIKWLYLWWFSPLTADKQKSPKSSLLIDNDGQAGELIMGDCCRGLSVRFMHLDEYRSHSTYAIPCNCTTSFLIFLYASDSSLHKCTWVLHGNAIKK